MPEFEPELLRSARKVLRLAARLWDNWLTRSPTTRFPELVARGYLLDLKRLVDEITVIRLHEQTWFRLGQAIVDLDHAGRGSWPWRWTDLSLVKRLCDQAKVRLADLVLPLEADSPTRGEDFYPENLGGWYHVEAGLQRLLGLVPIDPERFCANRSRTVGGLLFT